MKTYDAIVMVPTKVQIKTQGAGGQLTNAAHAAVDQMASLGKIKPFLHSMNFVSEEVIASPEPEGLRLA